MSNYTKLTHLIKIISVSLFLMLITIQISAQSVGDYRSVGNGNWTTSTNWQRYDGSNWVGSPPAPNSGDGLVTIRNNITVDGNQTANSVVVNNGNIFLRLKNL